MRSTLPGRAALAILVLASAACHRRGGETLKLSGNIEVVQVDVSFRTAGKVLERPVDEGYRVQRGQLIARLDARDLEQQVAQTRAAEATARAALAELLAGSRPEEIAVSRAALEQAVADLKRLEPDEDRMRDLRTKGILSQRDYEATHASFVAAKAKVDQARQQFVLVQKGPRREEIDQAKAKCDQAHQALLLAQTQLGYATLAAPSDGVILSKNVEPNEYVAPGTSVVTMADLSQVWLRAYLEEPDLGRVKVGQRATVTTDTWPGRRYEGRVSFISQEAEFTPKGVQTQKERVKLVYRVKIDVPNPALELKPGMPADVSIRLGEGGH